MYKIDDKKYPCSTSLAMKYIGGKWKAVILIHLFTKKSIQLKELENDGLISRTVYTSKPPLKVEYELTDLGKTLIPLLTVMAEWGKFMGENHLKVKTEPCLID